MPLQIQAFAFMEGVKSAINTETSAPTYLVSNDSVTQTI